MRSSLLTSVLVLLCLGCSTPVGSCLPAACLEGDELAFPRSTPEEQGLDSALILGALEGVRDDAVDLHGLIVLRHGTVVAECYVHPYGPETLHNVKSVSKSMISALCGIALEQGILGGLDRTVADCLPETFAALDDPRKREITLRHLLTMTAGLDLDENGPVLGAILASDDWIGATFARPLVDDPGTRFRYCTTLTHTMGAILSEAAGESLLEYGRESLFAPLGFGEVQWARGPRGVHFGGAELFLRPIDMARFGQMILDDGRWRGEEVVPAAWVEASTRNQLPREAGALYGYWWWVGEEGSFVAMGWGGQRILVMPSLDLVAVVTAGDHGASDALFRELRVLLPTDGPLPPNPEARRELEALVRELEHPVPREPDPLPDLAQEISGRRFVLEENGFGLESLTLRFPGGPTCELGSVLIGENRDLLVGLDGIARVTDTGTEGHMPEGNRQALTGRWLDERTFEIERNELGDPIRSRTTLQFDEDGRELRLVTLALPVGRRIELGARADG